MSQDIINKTTLPSGLRVVTENISSVRSLSVGVWIKTGSRHETDREAGITHFLEHMLFKGTEQRTPFQIAQTMESVGGYLNAFTSMEHTCYYTRCLDTELERAVDVLSDMVLHSTFPEEEIEKEKKVVIEEMKMYRDSPDDYVFEIFNGMVFNNHPLGRPIIGFEHTVNGFTRNDLKKYLDDRYNPANIVLAVAGNASHEDVIKFAEKYFSATKSEGQEVPVLELSPYEKQKKQVKKAIEQTHLVLGRRSLSTNHDDRYKLLLANTILSGGMSSRLHQNVREKYGYCYSINSFNQSYTDTGLFGVYVGTDETYVDHVQEIVYDELRKMGDDVLPAQELSEAKSQLKGKLLLAQESMSNRMTRLAKSEMYFDRYINLDELVEQIDAVTSDEIRNFSQEFFRQDQFTETILSPE
ncbi:MAG: insulinase family protein [Balneolales bacterium]|nr:insulinase family protein [Balneolales bacterium]